MPKKPLSLPPHRHGRDEPLCEVSAARTGAGQPHVVIVGAGFGGLAAARALKAAPVRVTLIDRRNHHLFQPLLYQVATAGLSPAQIATPIRAILRDQANVTVLQGDVEGIDRARREVLLGGQRIPFDYLVIATGARHAYFGHPEWEALAPGLKSIEDALGLRRLILGAFERAEAECDPAVRERLMTFAIVGAGPTGVEMAGAIAELARRALTRDFRNIDTRTARIVLIEAGPHVLPSFPETLSRDAERRLGDLGVELRLGAPVTDCDAFGVTLGNRAIPAATIIWAAGVMASPAARWLGIEADRAGRVPVGPGLSIEGDDRIFVIGDTATAKDAQGRALPGVAPVAKQQGAYVAGAIRTSVMGAAPSAPFRYRDFGNLATVGRKAAVVDFGRLRLTGFVAWLLWSLAHVYFLIGFRNRLAVAIDWLWAYLTFERGARLITGDMPAPSPRPAAAAAPPRIAA